MKHSDVPTALELVIEEVGKESQRIRDAGSVALKAGKLKPAKKAIAYAEKMQAFVRKVRALGDEWLKLQAEIDGAAPEVQEIVRPPKQQKLRKSGFKRNVGKLAPKTNFTVTFPDGKVIADKKASVVFAKTVEALGAEKSAKVGINLCGEPLVTKTKSEQSKYPSASIAISGGWYVATHCNTKLKIDMVRRLAKEHKVKLIVKGA